MDNNEENLSKDKEIKVVLPLNCNKITDKEGKKIVAIWLLPCAIYFPCAIFLITRFVKKIGKGFLSIRTDNRLFSDIIILFPWFVLWLLFGWILPALYFKWKHRDEKTTNTEDNSLIVTNPTMKLGINNVSALCFSFLITLLYYVIMTVVLPSIIDVKKYNIVDPSLQVGLALGINFLINFIAAAIMAVKAAKLKSSQYKECFSPLGIFVLTLIFGPLGMIFSLWGLLRVKFGNATLRTYSVK